MHKSTRHDANHPAEHQRVADVPIIKPHPPVQRGDAHTVAVVTYSGDDLLQDAARRQAARRNVGQIRVRDAEDVGGGNGFGPKACAYDIADATTDSCCGTAIRLNGAGMIVGFDFEAHRMLVVKSHHA